MIRDDVLAMLEPIVTQYLQGDKRDGPISVVRVPDGILILMRDGSGDHLLVDVNRVKLRVP